MVFAAIVGNLRRRVQVERLITTVILASLPVSLYGVLQRYKIDPVPWGGDVSRRIAANMGNSIFVAAYLIMAFPLTMLRMVESFTAILNDRGRLVANFSRATAYVFIAALQVIAIFFSGSRGPWLGWLASSFFLLVVLSLVWRKRWLTVGIVSVALVLAGFLVVLNIPSGPLDSLRSIPGIGRLGQLLSAESRTGRVRTLIWEGASELVRPHQPLEFPDGSKDNYNFLRPYIGYGPESMYVAYNSFYPPELTLVEKRNASPDRSHNETWDSLVITGVLGLGAYLTIFGSVFYYGLKWLGLLRGTNQRNLFLALYIGGGTVSAVGFLLWKDVSYLGISIPFGMIGGVIAYLIFISLFGHFKTPQTEGERLRVLTLLGLLAVVVAHFVEINFGIAIAATRTYFWTFAGLILVVGYVLPLQGEYENIGVSGIQIQDGNKNKRPPKAYKRKRRRTSRTGHRRTRRVGPAWIREAIIAGVILTILLFSLGFDFLSGLQGGTSASEIVWTSMVRLKNANSGISYGVLAMVLTTWLVAAVVFTSENGLIQDNKTWITALGVILGLSLLISLFLWLWHAAGLAAVVGTAANNLDQILQQVRRYENILTKYYIGMLLLISVGAFFLAEESIRKARVSSWVGMITAPIAIILVILISSYTNLRVIQADIAFKLADPFTKGNSWPVAIEIYKHAIELAPSEDFYYLFLGRAYLAHAETLDDPVERDSLLNQAAEDLKKAQTINPLNTDHTANLARLHSLWASYSNDPIVKEEKGEISDKYFSKAVTLSPNNSRIWDEWALLNLNILNRPDEALKLLTHSAEVDPYYDWTQALLGEYYIRSSQSLSDPQAKDEALEQAAFHYSEALNLARGNNDKLNYNISLGQLYIGMKEYQLAISAFEEAVRLAPNKDLWKYEQTLAQLYAQIGDKNNAIFHASSALVAAPDDQKPAVENLIAQLNAMP